MVLSCSALQYTSENYAGWYTFHEGNYGLGTFGITKSGGFLWLNIFFSHLRENNHLGLALKNWYRTLRAEEIADKTWYGYQTLIGDPTLKIFLPNETVFCPQPEKPQVVEGPNAREIPGEFFLKAKDPSHNPLCQRKGYLSIWQNGVKKYGSGWMNLEQDGSFSWTTPYLLPGIYEWRVNLQNKDGQSCKEPLKIPFRVARQCATHPPTPERISGPNYNETITQGRPIRVEIRDVTQDEGCFPQDVIFTLWKITSQGPVKLFSSGWLEDSLTPENNTSSWEFPADLEPGDYQWRSNLRNNANLTCQNPLIVPFSISPTSTPLNYCCCFVECGMDCWWDTSCSGSQKVRCDRSYCQ